MKPISTTKTIVLMLAITASQAEADIYDIRWECGGLILAANTTQGKGSVKFDHIPKAIRTEYGLNTINPWWKWTSTDGVLNQIDLYRSWVSNDWYAGYYRDDHEKKVATFDSCSFFEIKK